MLIPLWVPWAVAAALAVPVLVHTLTVRPPDHVPLWVGSVLVVPLVVAVSLSIDRFHVGEGELLDATVAAAAAVTGTRDVDVPVRAAAEVRDRLGRDVEVELVEGPTPDDALEGEDRAYYEVRPVGSSSGPVVCVDAQITGGSALEPGDVRLAVEGGRCDDA